MELPPKNILNAALDVLYVCSYTTRNWTMNDEISRTQINDLWEAIHEIPSLLTRWHPDAEKELIMYLDEYERKWPSPHLTSRYQQVRDAENGC